MVDPGHSREAGEKHASLITGFMIFGDLPCQCLITDKGLNTLYISVSIREVLVCTVLWPTKHHDIQIQGVLIETHT